MNPPDLNIIENVWQRLKRELQNDATCIATVNDLKARIRHLWENLPVNYVQSLYYSIPQHIKAVLKNNGNVRKYSNVLLAHSDTDTFSVKSIYQNM